MVSISCAPTVLAALQLIGAAYGASCAVNTEATCGSIKVTFAALGTALGAEKLDACTKKGGCSCSGIYLDKVVFAYDPSKPRLCIVEPFQSQGSRPNFECVCDPL